MKKLVSIFALLLLCLAQTIFPMNRQHQAAPDKRKSLGNPNAPMAIEIFQDFENLHCRAFYTDLLPGLMKDFVNTGKVYLIFREYPSSHPNSRLAANYAVAAARVGKYTQVSSAIFQNQQSWERSGKLWDTVAAALTPAEQKRVQSLLNDPAVLNEVEADIQRAQAMAVNQVPAMLLTNKGHTSGLSMWNDYKFLADYINELLR